RSVVKRYRQPLRRGEHRRLDYRRVFHPRRWVRHRQYYVRVRQRADEHHWPSEIAWCQELLYPVPISVRGHLPQPYRWAGRTFYGIPDHLYPAGKPGGGPYYEQHCAGPWRSVDNRDRLGFCSRPYGRPDGSCGSPAVLIDADAVAVAAVIVTHSGS